MVGFRDLVGTGIAPVLKKLLLRQSTLRIGSFYLRAIERAENPEEPVVWWASYARLVDLCPAHHIFG